MNDGDKDANFWGKFENLLPIVSQSVEGSQGDRIAPQL